MQPALPRPSQAIVIALVWLREHPLLVMLRSFLELTLWGFVWQVPGMLWHGKIQAALGVLILVWLGRAFASASFLVFLRQAHDRQADVTFGPSLTRVLRAQLAVQGLWGLGGAVLMMLVSKASEAAMAHHSRGLRMVSVLVGAATVALFASGLVKVLRTLWLAKAASITDDEPISHSYAHIDDVVRFRLAAERATAIALLAAGLTGLSLFMFVGASLRIWIWNDEGVRVAVALSFSLLGFIVAEALSIVALMAVRNDWRLRRASLA